MRACGYRTAMKIYTRTGDDGSTALFGGERVGKDNLRVSCYGSVDEANAALGMARAALAAGQSELDAELGRLQSLLFDLGADLATPHGGKTRAYIKAIDAADVSAVEEAIDRYTIELPALTSFVLPGGTASSAALQLARSVLRRAEREAVTLARGEEIGEQVLPLLNRLSDLLFTLARVACIREGAAEVAWQPRRPG